MNPSRTHRRRQHRLESARQVRIDLTIGSAPDCVLRDRPLHQGDYAAVARTFEGARGAVM